LAKDRGGGEPDRDGDFNDPRYDTPLPEKLPDRTLTERGWPGDNGLLREKGPVSNHGNKADTNLHEGYAP